jgi:uncharacterized glyoxalase superfamily protein PhnB
MVVNRSMPAATIIPVLAYADVAAAVTWLCEAFGFAERLRIGTHRAQLTFGAGAIVVVQHATHEPLGQITAGQPGPENHAVMVRIADVDLHYGRAQRFGAQVGPPPTDYPYGERQYSVVDLGGHRWTFSQSIADVEPGAWGGTLIGDPVPAA